MRNALFTLPLLAILVLAGCAGTPAQPPAAPPVQPQVQPAPPANITPENATPAQPAPVPNETSAAPADKCVIEFQKDASSVYFVMVKTDSQKNLTVTCPNGNPAEKRGGLYFCESLDAPNPAIAYLDGTECGRADFSKAAEENAAPGNIQCTVLLSASRITVGGTSQVTVQAYSPSDSDVLTYKCGDSEVTEHAGGLINTGKICTFNTPGTIEIYAKINNQTCGFSLLDVFEKAKECSVLSTSLDTSKGGYDYTARVAGRGYSGGDLLKYRCYDIPYQIRVDSFPNSTDFITTIECKGNTPLTDSVPVSVGGDACGALLPPAQ
jgi:hypothetical protein